jgi:sulfite reductase (NADPH) flavoprotein alpha-component
MRIPTIDPQNTLLTAQQVGQWNAFVASLSGDQIPWLLGFLSAATQMAQAPQGSAQAAGASPSAPQGGITVLFASQTGNAAKLAKRLGSALTGVGLAASVISASDYKTTNLKNEKLLVLISSTQGEGAVPDSAAELHRFLFGKRAPKLAGLRFAVLALGDYSYRHFCKAGADFDRRLEELGAERLLPRVDCDVDYQATAEAWQAEAVEALKKLAPAALTVVQETTPPAPPMDEPAFDKQRPFHAAVLERINLNGRGSDKTTTHLELSLTGAGIVYQPGDALGVLPRNDPSTVDNLLTVARLSGEAPVSVDGQDMPLSTALREHFEITTITRPFVQAYTTTGRRPELAAFLHPENDDDFQSYCYGREIVDLLTAYPPGPLAPQEFVGTLRRLQPRLYSIASSLRAHQDEVHILVGLTLYQSYGCTRRGVCSSYLCERLGEDEPVRVYPSPSPHFRLPVSPDAPIIMIGPGTGVAPFRAFMEEREAQGCRGRNWLFFGDQHFATDFLYQVEWQRWHSAGLLSRVDLAFSRDQENKVYVQHRMQEQARELYAWLQDGAHVYVCGDAARMAADVHARLLDIVAKQGGKDPEAAEQYLEDLQSSKRYQRDVY